MQLTDWLPYCFHTSTADSGDTPYPPKKVISSRMPYTRLSSAPISLAFSRVMPFTWASRSGSCSITSSDLAPKVCMILLAMAGPTPFTAPEERYLSMAAVVAGLARSKAWAINCSP